MKRSPFADLAVLVVSTAWAVGCTECTEYEEKATYDLPDETCDVGRCAEWRTGPCMKTCAAFVSQGAIEITGCEGPHPDPERKGALVVECRYVAQSCKTEPSFGKGRPQSRHVPRGARAGSDPVGLFFAAAAEAEESSVHAFHELARELTRWRAPSDVVLSCLEAAGDEERHRGIMTELAARYGAVPSRALPRPSPSDDIEALARENMEQGCVAELWSAAETVHAAVFATDTSVRSQLLDVARDEARHAKLAFELDAFFATQLDERARSRVAAARARAVARLRSHVLRAADTDALVVAGLVPPRRLRRRLLDALFSDASTRPIFMPREERACGA